MRFIVGGDYLAGIENDGILMRTKNRAAQAGNARFQYFDELTAPSLVCLKQASV